MSVSNCMWGNHFHYLQVEEGLCQLMALIWLDLQYNQLSRAPEQQRLASYLAFQIRNDTSDIYGESFASPLQICYHLAS